MPTSHLAWHRRLEARVILGIVVLVALSLAVILVATTRVVTVRSLQRTADDLGAARHAFHRLVAERAEFASAQSSLVTSLPVFRAHLTDDRLMSDVATLEAMADHYRQQLKATFAIVGDRDARWIATSGWPREAPPPAGIAGAIAEATAGAPARRLAITADRLFLVVSEPAGFADEMLGTLTIGYALDDQLAQELAAATHREVNLVGDRGVYASSLPADERAALASMITAEKDGFVRDAASSTLRTIGGREFAAGVFPLVLDGAAPVDAQLILLDDWSQTQAFLSQLRWRLLLTGAVMFMAAMAMGIVFSRRMTRPLEDLAAAAQDIAGGNWTRQLPVRGSAEEAVMAQAVNAMTTSLRHWYEEAKERDDQLRQAQKVEALGRLAGGVAHDFNNFLTAIKGYGELLLEDFDAADDRRSNVEGILKAADTAAGMTRQLLAFSRKRVVAVQVLPVERVLAGSEKMLQRLIGSEIDLTMSVAPGTGCVKADPHQLDQVLLNLVVNARDAMPHGGSIDVRLDGVSVTGAENVITTTLAPGHYVRLTVRDTGCGMTPEVKARIFEPFFTTKQEGAGTGLGLAVVCGIVEQLGGGIAVDTEVGRGTAFHVYVPHTAEAQDGAAAQTPAASAAGGAETILLVEDEPQVAEIVTHALGDAGYTVLAATRGTEALELLQASSSRVDLLLTDIVMPGMNGRELADRVRQARPGIRVLYMSGYADDAVLRHGVEAATMQFIAKPVSIRTLTGKVREALAA